MDMWQAMNEINTELRESILCVPPYKHCITEEFIGKMYKKKNNNKLLVNNITNIIISPWQRAYQMEFRYKKTKIFEPFIPVLEYGVFSSVLTDWVCAYLTLLPVVEASLRRWMILEENMSLKSLHKFYYTFGKYSKKYIGGYDDKREHITKEYIRYLKHGFRVLFMSFEECHRKNLKEIFNRNLALHKLEGAMDSQESLRNVTRILLLLDVIAELYLMQEPDDLWQTCISADPEHDIDFQLRWHLYEKKASIRTGHNDFLIVQNALVGKSSDKKKRELLRRLKEDVV
ncbi:hypothetical protein R83H12_02544 [Fibrobacteria bacterium R8-3-H12]